MTDTRPWIKVAETFPEHPKTMQLSDAAFRALVTFWCYCSRTRTDGFLPRKWAKTQAKPAVIRELLSVGFIAESEKNGGGYECHDYLEHQTSAEDRTRTMQQRKKSGSQGGTLSAHKRWHVARNRRDPTCEHCQDASTG